MTKRVIASFTVTIERNAEDVFDYLADVSRHAEWSPKPYRVEGVEPGPAGLGTRFTSYGYLPRQPDHRNDVEVAQADRPRRLELVSTDGGERFVNTYVLTPDGNRTRVDRTFDLVRPSGALGVVFPILLAAVIKPDVRKGMGMLKANLERAV